MEEIVCLSLPLGSRWQECKSIECVLCVRDTRDRERMYARELSTSTRAGRAYTSTPVAHRAMCAIKVAAHRVAARPVDDEHRLLDLP